MDNDWTDSKGSSDGSASGDAAFTTIRHIGTHAGTFDGTGDYADFGSNTILGDNPFTISAWLNTDTVSKYTGALSIGGSTTGQGAYIGTVAAAQVGGANSIGGGMLGYNIGTNVNSLNTWHYVVLTSAGGVGGNVVMYVDGEARTTTTYTSNLISNYTRVGRISDLTIYDFDGEVDDAAIWNVALTAPEIAEIYDRQKSDYAGNFTSEIKDAGADSSWDSLAWNPQQPSYKELPDSATTETGYTAGNADMTGNVLLLHMDESSGTIVDSSGQGNNGTYNGTSYSQNGKINTSINFDGNDYVALGTDAQFDVTSNYSIGLWFYMDSYSDAYDGIFNRVTGINNGYVLYFNQASDKLTYLTSGAHYFSCSNDLASTYIGKWTHVVVSADATNVTCYVNGIASTPNVLGGTSGGASTPFNIGQLRNVGSGYFNGSVDEFFFNTSAMTADEVLDIYRRGANRLKYQVRSCDDAACSGESFIGPDGTTATYYSELSNSSLTLPTFTLTNVPDNQYFQYKTYFESDDASYSPELKSATVDYTLLNASPNAPTNTNPLNASISQPTSLTFTSSAFSDGDIGDTHLASQWQISTTSADYGTPVYDSGTDVTNLTSLLIPAGTLEGSTKYYWHVRHQDNNSAWSSYSTETYFTTKASGQVTSTIQNPSVTINNTDTCTSNQTVVLTLSAENATEVLISDSPLFVDANWETYSSSKNYTFTDTTFAEKIVYVKYKSSTGNQSIVVTDSIFFLESADCSVEPVTIIVDEPIVQKTAQMYFTIIEDAVSRIRGITPEVEDQLVVIEDSLFGLRELDESGQIINSPTSEVEQIFGVSAGDYVQGEAVNTIYVVDKDNSGNLTKNPVLDLVTFYTHEQSISIVKKVADTTLRFFNFGKFILPKPYVVLLKFRTSDQIYVIHENPNDKYTPILYTLTNSQYAVEALGKNWPEYIVELDETFYGRFIVNGPVTSSSQITKSTMKTFKELEAMVNESR